MTMREAPQGDRTRWDALDAALATIRTCRSMSELAECAGVLAVQGCGAEATALGRIADGLWSPWLRSGDLALLESAGVLPPAPVSVDEAPPLEQQVIGSRQVGVRDLPGRADGCQVAVAAIASQDTLLGLLHVVARDLRVEIVEWYAGALGSMVGLLGVRRRAEEQRHILARLRHGLADSAERSVELYDLAPGIRGDRSPLGSPRMSSTDLRARLTPRQREVLDLMLSGLSNTEIAERLVVAVPTVKSHVRAVLRVSGAVNRSDAVAQFARR